jgi:hypothetical protein
MACVHRQATLVSDVSWNRGNGSPALAKSYPPKSETKGNYGEPKNKISSAK